MTSGQPPPGGTEQQKRVRQLTRLVELGVVLNSTLNLDELLRLITRTATMLLDCEAASILLYDEKRPHLFFAASSDPEAGKLSQISVPVEGSIAGTILRTNRPLNLSDVAEDPRHYSYVSKVTHFETRSLLGVPMRIRQRVTGVLEALNKQAGSFTDEDESILNVIASYAAVAIHNARLMQALKQTYEEVKEANRVKSNFLALASHELRTPLGIIIGYATFLREDAQGKLSEHAEHVLHAALQMRAIVEDMTNLTLLEKEGVTFKPQNVPIQTLLESACEEIRPLAEARAQTLIFDLPPQPLIVYVDVDKMRGTLVNILNNAVRFSPQGARLAVGAAAEGAKVLAWVQDNGIGIPQDRLKKIFEEFYQVESPNVRRFGGLGIGLTIAKGLIEAQGGEIWAESEGEGKGSTFKVLLPAAASARP